MDIKAESEPFLESAVLLESSRAGLETRRQRLPYGQAITIGNVVLFCSSFALYWLSRQRQRQGPFQTDIRDAWPAVQYEDRTFTGALKHDAESKELYREHDAEREYFGPPSILIEDAWDRLLHDEFVPMTAEEAAPFQPELTVLPWEGKFFFEPDVLHFLHCINGIRKELSNYMYNSSASHFLLLFGPRPLGALHGSTSTIDHVSWGPDSVSAVLLARFSYRFGPFGNPCMS
ncbi:hypothetical protein M409DRAFT_29236 [Zasmidium cellare ATCC 36951]|uniref:Uncharacterized protein n=1 Tax=Zasmidium cellare ATCC 36951 TaxID=1080233 RepID=A0A6A6C2I1_ZASCE|nr:uncharacterized protein M409DRAFT_29236 [Zasmidium cellare ATCC 36951]KAF2160390.1 hypothetical protein M409DRAFT_29236 [Zasmidium cellare ATCC 36951]